MKAMNSKIKEILFLDKTIDELKVHRNSTTIELIDQYHPLKIGDKVLSTEKITLGEQIVVENRYFRNDKQDGKQYWVAYGRTVEKDGTVSDYKAGWKEEIKSKEEK